MEEKKKEEVVSSLLEQMKVEGKLIALYENTVQDIQSKPVRHLLNTIKLDSMKHIDICSTALEILQGADVLKEEKMNLKEKLAEHVELEKGSIDRANNMLKNVWIRENKALTELIEKLRDDEKRHTEALRKLADKTFFRWDGMHDMISWIHDAEWEDERYRRSKERKKQIEKLETK
jgi:rubrerythrin